MRNTPKKSISLTALYLVVCIVFIAATLRAPITAVGPVIPEMVAKLRLTSVSIGLFTAIPLICFSLLSTFMPRFSLLAGLERLLVFSLLLLGIGIIIRSSGSVFYLFAGSIFIGIAITIGNVLMPAFIKKRFPNRGGAITGIYLFSMNICSALAVGYSIRIGTVSGLGWKGSIGIWAFPAMITFFIWLPLLRRGEKPTASFQASSISRIWRSRLAWQISIFMGLQSVVFYALAAWLPTILQGWGMDAERAGWMLSYIQLGQVPMMILGPAFAARMKNQTPLIWITFILWMVGISLMIFFKARYIAAATLIAGAAVGLAFALATIFFLLRTRNVAESAALSGMAQSVGYFEAALAPPLFGIIHDLTHSWMLAIWLLLVLGFVLLFTGLYSARDRFV